MNYYRELGTVMRDVPQFHRNEKKLYGPGTGGLRGQVNAVGARAPKLLESLRLSTEQWRLLALEMQGLDCLRYINREKTNSLFMGDHQDHS